MSQSHLVYLNIGGSKFVTTSATLERDGPNFFTALLSNKFGNLKDRNDNYFIDRPGKYFEPILNYLTTGNIDIPKEISSKLVVCEAEFYGIKFPLLESDQHLNFITDEWLIDTTLNVKYTKIFKDNDDLLIKVISSFKEKALTGEPIKSKIYCRSSDWAMQWKEEKYWNYKFHYLRDPELKKEIALNLINFIYSSERVENDSLVQVINEGFYCIQKICKQNGLSINLETHKFISFEKCTSGVYEKEIILGYQIVSGIQSYL